MIGPEEPPDRLETGPGLASTDPDRTIDRSAGAKQCAGPSAETRDFTLVPPTEHATVGEIDDPVTAGTIAMTGSIIGTQPIDTSPLEAGLTLDALTDGNHGATAAFDLDPAVASEDAERTLPRPEGVRTDRLPLIVGFEILEVLGIGGMGIVYKARQTRLDRFVALKMIRAGAGAHPADLVRFEAEARAVAAIDHPNIIKIFEIGEHAGLPYFSVEYLEGGSLARRIDGKPQPPEQSARTVEVLARAMDVAHRRGIIHRDLKPANILLAPDGTLKIADFGLAKRLEGESSQTRTGSVLGSPSYMAPEQALGDAHVGPAADQYALGATLYELLTGRAPFRGTSVLETLDMVRTKDPVPPSQLLPRMPRDLETICLKCLEKDPARRYPDVASLADDLRRFQAGEPIVARPVSAIERSWRWCLRNRGVAALAASVALLLMAVTAVSAYAAVAVGRKNRALGAANADLKQANDALLVANARAEERRREAEAEHRRALVAARAAFDQNRSVVDTQREMIGLLEDKLRFVPALQEVREKTLDMSTRSLESAAASMNALRTEIGWPPVDEELNWRTLARVYQRLGELSLSRNQAAEAMKRFRQVDEIITRLAGAASGDPGAQIRLARSRRQLGFLALERLGDGEEARRLLIGSVELIRSGLAKQPDDDSYKYELANGLGHLALVELKLGHLQRARALYDEEVAVRESFAPAFATRTEIRRERSGLYERLGELSIRMGDRDGGRRFYDLCAALREQVLAERPDFWPAVYDLARSYNNAGFLLFPAGREPAAARAFHRRAADLISRRVEADPTDFLPRSALAEALYYEATCALHSGDHRAADAGYRRCLRIREALATDPKEKLARVNLMTVVARCGDHARAGAIGRELLATPPQDEQILYYLACAYALAAGAAGAEQQRFQGAIGSIPSAMAAGIDAALVRLYTDAALDCLRKGKQRGWADIRSLEIDPDLEPIRNDPAFRAFIAEFPGPASKRP